MATLDTQSVFFLSEPYYGQRDTHVNYKIKNDILESEKFLIEIKKNNSGKSYQT